MGSRVAVGVSLNGIRVWVTARVPLSWSVPVRAGVEVGLKEAVDVKRTSGVAVARFVPCAGRVSRAAARGRRNAAPAVKARQAANKAAAARKARPAMARRCLSSNRILCL